MTKREISTEQVEGFWPTIRDGATGVRGSYYIGRLIRLDEPYWEFWNNGRWCSAAQVFETKAQAQEVLENLRKL